MLQFQKNAATTAITDYAKENKISKKHLEAILAIIEDNSNHITTKVRGANPPILNEDGTIKEAYCRYHQRYYPADKMVISKGKSKGYSKLAISKWNKAQREIKKMREEANDLIIENKIEEAQALVKAANELKETCLTPEYYLDQLVDTPKMKEA